MEEIEATVSGRVQLVMYRDFSARMARRLGLTGFVKNNTDGTVSVVAQGAKEKLIQYIDYLKRGSLLSRVDTVSVSWGNAARNYSGFVIRY